MERKTKALNSANSQRLNSASSCNINRAWVKRYKKYQQLALPAKSDLKHNDARPRRCLHFFLACGVFVCQPCIPHLHVAIWSECLGELSNAYLTPVVNTEAWIQIPMGPNSLSGNNAQQTRKETVAYIVYVWELIRRLGNKYMGESGNQVPTEGSTPWRRSEALKIPIRISDWHEIDERYISGTANCDILWLLECDSFVHLLRIAPSFSSGVEIYGLWSKSAHKGLKIVLNCVQTKS